MRLAISVVSALACVACIFGRPDLTHIPQASVRDRVWFVLSEGRKGKIGIDPLAKIIHQQFVPVSSGCDPTIPEYKNFTTSYLLRGLKYSVTFGGAPAGTVVLQGSDPNYGTDIVEYQGGARIRGLVMALATNTELPAASKPARQSASLEERRLALELAREKFAEKGLPEKLLSAIAVDNLTHTTFAPEKSASLVGAFNVPLPGGSGITHYLFFVASEAGNKLNPEFVWTNISDSETGNEALRLVDQADLFGDGQQELVTVLTYYEDYRYRVYRRTRDGGGWELIF